MTEACLDDTALAAHLDASCDDGERGRVEAHLDACAACRAIVAEFGRTYLVAEGDAFAPRTTPVLASGTRLGRYLVGEPIGEGAMGIVYVARDTELDRKIAIKVLRVDVEADVGADGVHPNADSGVASVTGRLLDEARMMAKLTHPNVIAVHDVDVCDGLAFVVMEFAPGSTLRAWASEQARSASEVLAVYLDAARGLAAAHALGIVHRDFKPDNVVLGHDGRARITDFGLASADGIEAARAPEQDLGQPLHTRTGLLVGTPAYMAPEQLDGGLGDARSDQFAFAVSLYEALVGARPFDDQPTSSSAGVLRICSTEELRARIRAGLPNSAAARLPRRLRRTIARALAADPAARFPSMTALVRALSSDSRSQLLRVLAVGVVGALVLGVGLERRSAAEAACMRTSDAPWTATSSAAIELRFRAVAPDAAAEAWPRVAAQLDAYARRLGAERGDVCRAPVAVRSSEERTDLRSRCLDRRRDELEALVTVLADADEVTVRRATSAAYALTPIDVCNRASVGGLPTPVPDDPIVAATVEELRRSLARAAALERAGKYDAALTVTRPLAERAAATGFLPIQAEVLFRRGSLEELAGDSKSARATLLAAVDAAEAGRHDEVAADAWIALLFVVGNELEMHAEAELVAARARAASARVGSPARLEARLLANVGSWLHVRGRFADAALSLRRAVTLAERANTPDVAATMTLLSQSLREAGEVPEAIALADRALLLQEGALGPTHPSVAETLNALGVALSRAGRYAEAVPIYERALAIDETTFGRAHPTVGMALGNLGLAYARCGRFDDGVAALDRALVIDIEVWGPDDSETATALGNLGHVQLVRGNLADARRALERSIAIRERSQGAAHPFVARTLSNLGWVALAEGKMDEARASFERALAILERANGASHPDVAAQLAGLGASLIATDPARARTLFERALGIYASGAAAPDKLADAKFGLARALVEQGHDRPRARVLAEEARANYASLGGYTERKRIEVERWLALHAS